MIMNDGMTSRRVMRACFAVAALALLACAQGCGESARPVATPLAASVRHHGDPRPVSVEVTR